MSTACLPHYTSGQTYFYPAFNAARTDDALKFAHEFGEVLAMPIMLEAVMRVRASRGLRMASFHGNFFVRSTDLLAMPAVPQDQSYAIEVQIEETITAPFVVMQTAVLHTTCFGEYLSIPLVDARLTSLPPRRTSYPRGHLCVPDHYEHV